MPQLRADVINAFKTLSISTDATQEEAARAYKTQAIRHHPDKNFGDPTATQRFQELGAAWEILQKHFTAPSHPFATGDYDDDDEYMSPEDLPFFFVFIFEELISGRYAGRRDYRSRRAHPSHFFGVFANMHSSSNSDRYQRVTAENSQENEKAEYEKRLREFEMEIAAEQREIERQAKEKSKDEDKRTAAYQLAFKAARTGDAATVMQVVQEHNLDVNSPEKVPKSKKTEKRTGFQTLLHAACRGSGEELLIYLLEKGAIPDAIDNASLHPFHVAIGCGNVAAVQFLLLRRVNGRLTPGCHPSKAAPDGRTPLHIAISSGNAEMVTLLIKHATVHDVERCWHLAEAVEFRGILSAKKGFVDPKAKEVLRQEEERKLAEKRAHEEQKVADQRARLAEKARAKEEQAQKRAAERLLRQQEEEAKRKEEELVRQKREAEEAARQKAERQAREKMAAEARQRAAYEARVQAEAEVARKAREAQLRAEARTKELAEELQRARRREEEELRRRKAAQAEAERLERESKAAAAAAVVRQQEEELRRRNAARAEAERLEREAQAAAARQEAEVEARRQDAIRAKAAAQEAERSRRDALKLEAKRAETLRRLQGQAEEHLRQAEARMQVEHPTNTENDGASLGSLQRRKLMKKGGGDARQISAQELEKRAAQSARDKARIAQEKTQRMQETVLLPRLNTPEADNSGRDYFPPTPVSMPSPSQHRPPLQPPAIPRNTRPNIQSRSVDEYGVVIMNIEDIQTGAIPDDLFAPEPKVERDGFAARETRGRGGGYRGRPRRGRGWRVAIAE